MLSKQSNTFHFKRKYVQDFSVNSLPASLSAVPCPWIISNWAENKTANWTTFEKYIIFFQLIMISSRLQMKQKCTSRQCFGTLIEHVMIMPSTHHLVKHTNTTKQARLVVCVNSSQKQVKVKVAWHNRKNKSVIATVCVRAVVFAYVCVLANVFLTCEYAHFQ